MRWTSLKQIWPIFHGLDRHIARGIVVAIFGLIYCGGLDKGASELQLPQTSVYGMHAIESNPLQLTRSRIGHDIFIGVGKGSERSARIKVTAFFGNVNRRLRGIGQSPT